MRKQKQRVILTFIYVILLVVLVCNIEVVKNHMDVMYGLVGGIIIMTITNTLNDFQSKKEEEREFRELCRRYGVSKWKNY